MPPLPLIAGLYLVGLIVLRLLYIGAVNAFGLPNTLASTVILAAAPAAFIGAVALRRATRALAFKDWAVIWGIMMSIYLILNVVIPAMLVPGFRDVMNDVTGLRSLVMVSVATAAMLVLFLWIGTRTVRR